MKRFFCSMAALSVLSLSHAQNTPTPDRLLPADTLGVFTIPDMVRARHMSERSASMQLWGDPSMKAFTDKFLTKFQEEVIQPFEKESGIQLTNYLGLAQGQVTLALTRNGWTGQPDQDPGFVVLIDSKGERQRMTDTLADLKKRWIENGQPLKNDTIRGVDFSVLLISREQVEEFVEEDELDVDGQPEAVAVVDEEEIEPLPPREIFVGQSGTLLLVGTSKLDLEKILNLQFGGPVMSLAESTAFMGDYNEFFRDSIAYGWFNIEPVIEMVMKSMPEPEPGNPFAFNPDRVFRATGLSAIKTVAFSSNIQNDGEHFNVSLKVPETARQGLFRMLTFEARDAAPPSFVAEDVLSFYRVRINLRKSWEALESMLVQISPQMGGVIKMGMESIGKDKDPTFDFRAAFVGNLGDDVISWTRKPRENSLEAISNQPEIILIGSPRAEEFANAVKFLIGMVPPDLGKQEEREFLGRKIHTIDVPMGMPTAEDAAPPTQSFAFSSSGSYFALSTDIGLLEEFLRSADGDGRPLLNRTGLRVAAEKVGGMASGLFGYTNDRETMRFIYKFLTSTDGSGTGGLSGLNQFLEAAGMNDEDSEFKEWVDFSLLPPFTQIEKYFNYTVVGGRIGEAGYQMKAYSPKSPEL